MPYGRNTSVTLIIQIDVESLALHVSFFLVDAQSGNPSTEIEYPVNNVSIPKISFFVSSVSNALRNAAVSNAGAFTAGT